MVSAITGGNMAVIENLLTVGAEPTTDIEQAKQDLTRFGYCLIENALSAEQVAVARHRLVEQAEAEEQRELSYHDGGTTQRVFDADGKLVDGAFTVANGGVNQRLWMLINKGECFRDLVTHELTDELVGHVLGSAFILSTLGANIVKPGGSRMGLHTDQWWMPQPVRPDADYHRPSELTRRAVADFVDPDPTLGISPPVVANCMWMVSDFSAENGATEVVPGSHLTGAHPRQDDQSSYPIRQPEAPAGTLMVFDGRLWHGTGAHAAGEDRLGVLATYCSPQFRQQENEPLGIDRGLWDDMTMKLKTRLGFAVWNAYGRIESPADHIISPEPDRIGELRPS